jgi:hypothetical protein
MIQNEDVLFDWSIPMYVNYTHVNIVDRMEEFFKTVGHVERIQGEVYLCKDNKLDNLELGELPSNEVVNLFGHISFD